MVISVAGEINAQCLRDLMVQLILFKRLFNATNGASGWATEVIGNGIFSHGE